MALQTELMAHGAQAQLAKAIGSSSNLAVAAAASDTATGATLIISRYNLVTTSGASTNSLLLKSATDEAEVIIQVASGQTTVNIFPQSAETIVDEGAQGAAGAAVTLAASKAAVFYPAGNVWYMVRGA